MCNLEETYNQDIEDKKNYHNTYMLLDKIKLIEHIHYVVKHDTLKEKETLKLLELRDRLINEL